MKKREKIIMRKALVAFVSVLIISIAFTFLISLNAPTIRADEQSGCCEKTKTGLLCTETTRDFCAVSFHSGQACSKISQCKPQTCIFPDGPCMAQKTVAECKAAGGTPDSNPIESIAVCQKGCCGIAKGIVAKITQRKECTELALLLGYRKEDTEFDNAITSQTECFIKYDTTSKGCCVLGGGQCLYGVRSECSSQGGNFVPLNDPTKFCRDVTGCAVTHHKYCSCGKLPNTEFDIYWFDSQGNQEEQVGSLDSEKCNNIDKDKHKFKEQTNNGNCDYPSGICMQEENEQVYCKDTSCTINGVAQKIDTTKNEKGKWTTAPPKVLMDEIIVETLFTGQSMCYNFFTTYEGESFGDFSVNNYTTDQQKYGRSTGLQNEILHCRLGEIEIEGLGVDREKLCVMGGSTESKEGEPSTQNANVKENNWENCSMCGSASGFLGGARNLVGDFFGPTLFGIPSGKLLASIGGYCTKDRCEGTNDNTGYGDCYYHQDSPGYGGNLIGSTPTGSCDPIYPPGTSARCGNCGGGGDYLYNICTRAECYSQGNCQFSSAGPGRYIWTTALLTFSLSWATRTPLIVPECLTTQGVSLVCKSTPGCCIVDPLTCNFNFFTCIADRTKTYTVGGGFKPVKFFIYDVIWEKIIMSMISSKVNEAAQG